MPPGSAHHAAQRCGRCDTFLRWVPKPETQERQRQQGQTIRQLLNAPGLSHWEQDFLRSIKGQKKLSPKQAAVVARIEAKVGGVAR